MKNALQLLSAVLISIVGFGGYAKADAITFQSDGSTLGAVDNNLTDLYAASDITSILSGLSFSPVIQDSLGTFTPIPAGAPAGTEVVNIPGGSYYDGENGFFLVDFTLPTTFSAPVLSGLGNVDDQGWVFLNGNNLSGAYLTEFGDSAFGTSDASLFLPGLNQLVVSDDNSGGGPSGTAFYGTVTYNATVPDTGGLWLTLCFGLVCAAMACCHRRVRVLS